MKFIAGKASHGGRNPNRPVNQDTVEVVELPDGRALYLVCDGMGGHAAGEIASQLAAKEIIRTVQLSKLGENAEAILKEGIEQAYQAIKRYALDHQLREGMGTTVVAGLRKGNQVVVAHVGDSRAYHLRRGKIQQKTEDHSEIAEGLRLGLLTTAEAATSTSRGKLTRSINWQRPSVEPDFTNFKIKRGDALVFCSDGLWGELSDDEIRAVVETMPAQAAAEKLVYLANLSGGSDNVSVVVVSDIDKQPMAGDDEKTGEHPVIRLKKLALPIWWYVNAVLLILGLLAISIAFWLTGQ